MSRRMIPVKETITEWHKDPAFQAAFAAQDEEFALADALIRARAQAEMTQEEVAQAMGTTQTFVAKLESGRSMPSTRTLARFAKATNTRLRILFEPEREKSGLVR